MGYEVAVTIQEPNPIPTRLKHKNTTTVKTKAGFTARTTSAGSWALEATTFSNSPLILSARLWPAGSEKHKSHGGGQPRTRGRFPLLPHSQHQPPPPPPTTTSPRPSHPRPEPPHPVPADPPASAPGSSAPPWPMLMCSICWARSRQSFAVSSSWPSSARVCVTPCGTLTGGDLYPVVAQPGQVPYFNEAVILPKWGTISLRGKGHPGSHCRVQTDRSKFSSSSAACGNCAQQRGEGVLGGPEGRGGCAREYHAELNAHFGAVGPRLVRSTQIASLAD